MSAIDNSRNPSSTALLLFFCRYHVPLLSKFYRLLHNSDIYCNLKGRDIYMPHPYGIIIHSKTIIGQHVTIMQQVTLGGGKLGINEAPVIEDYVYIGAGAKVLGNVHIGQQAVIGANAVITRDVPAGATVVGANRMIKTENEHKT
jgi:serine O-acetyltransferase